MDHKRYLSDPGIFKKGNKFYYNNSHKEVIEIKELNRLSKIRVPPAWKSVWYSSKKNCHIQVYGIDVSGKKQYILSEKWINNSKYEKFNRMKSFIRNIVPFKKKIKLNNTLNKENIIHLLFNLLIDTHIRVGNEIYADQNKTYGLTTLRQKHLILKDNIYYFSFTGKSKIKHNIQIPENYCSLIKKLIISDKNKPLFYYDNFKIISSE